MTQSSFGLTLPGPGRESVWDYPLPPAPRPGECLVTAAPAGVEIMRSKETIRILETSHPPTFYIPPGKVRTRYLELSRSVSSCEFKGEAVFFNLRVGDRHSEDAAWCYPNPSPGYEAITGFFAFYPNKVDECTVGGEKVKPQPGGYDGGWITPDVVGPFKGEPGAISW
jgi:uncharacterized protein (DUF427 family)